MSVYDVCTDCGYLRVYTASGRASTLARCPLCTGTLVRSPTAGAYPPVYVGRTRQALARVPALGSRHRPRRRGAVHDRRRSADAGVPARLAGLRTAIADGSYRVDAGAVAAAMLRSPAARAALIG